MFASKRAGRPGINLDDFLTRLKEALIRCSGALMSASRAIIPQWALNCTHLLYSHKSIHPDLSEPGELYITYKMDDPSAVNLVGKSKDSKPINRRLEITRKAGDQISIVSKHKNLETGELFSCEGVGKTFHLALDKYFSSSNLKRPDYTYNTEGDAFLLPQVLDQKGEETWVGEIVKAVREMMSLVPEDKHPEVLHSILENIQDFGRFLKSREKDKIPQHYDARLWLIVETVCKHFDPLTAAEHPKRKDLRDYFIAESCSKLAKGEDIIPRLKAYFEAMKMHLEIFQTCEQDHADGRLKALIEEYKKNNLLPEMQKHHEKIGHYHGKCKGDENRKESIGRPGP